MSDALEGNRNALQQNVAEDQIDLKELLGVLLAGRWIIILSVIASFIVGAIYALGSQPIFASDISVQIEESSAGSVAMMDVGEMFGSQSGAATEIEVIRSRTMVQKVVDKLGLDIRTALIKKPLLDNLLGTYDGLPQHLNIRRLTIDDSLFGQGFILTLLEGGRYSISHKKAAVGVGEAHKKFQPTPEYAGLFDIYISELPPFVSNAQYALRKISKLQATAALRGRLSASEVGKNTGVIRVSLQGDTPVQIRNILQTLGEVYVQQNVQRHSEEAKKSLSFLDEQLPELRRNLDASEFQLNNYLSDNKLVDLSAESTAVLNQVIEVEKQLSELKLKRAELSQSFNSRHPSIVTLDEQQQQLAATKAKLESQISGLPEAQQTVLRLSRDVEVASEIYTFLLNRAQELRVIEAGTVGNVRMLDHAILPYSPIKPKKMLIIMLSVLIGGMFGVAVVMLRKAMHTALESPAEIEQKLGLSVYAVIPYSGSEQSLLKRKTDGGRDLLAATKPNDLAVEALRSLRTSLHFAMMDASNNRVMISGPSPGIGKSFISCNLGYLLAESGKKVALVDADMRKGHCHEYFRGRRQDGLSELLSMGAYELDDYLQEFPKQPKLSLVSTGKLPPNPSELLMSSRFPEVLEELGKRFDIVLIDTPPIMAVADAGIVLPHTGAGFVVARAGVNPLSEIDQSIKRLSKDGGKVSGVLFNGMKRTEAKYGAYSYYQYEYN